MKTSISNIGWAAEQDSEIYDMMKDLGFSGLEIAPTRVFPDAPYDRLAEAEAWSERLMQVYGLEISSMQSIWFGRQEKIFGTLSERVSLTRYTKKAIDFASVIGCKNLVFGCPRNRAIPEGMSQEQADAIARPFFQKLGDYAAKKNTVLAMEANPTIYNTNYINGTQNALDLVQKVDSEGFLLNLDVGTMLQNQESLQILAGNIHLIHHVHISEPELKIIQERPLHHTLAKLLHREHYHHYVSIEMGKQDSSSTVKNAALYLRKII